MEKDYFKDRPIDICENDKIFIGDEVYICTKEMQKYAKEINDLNRVIVKRKLTSQKYHPRGQKIQGIDVISKDILVGRCVYLCDSNRILTKDGYKYLFYDVIKNTYFMKNLESLCNYNEVYLSFKINEYTVRVNIYPYTLINKEFDSSFIDVDYILISNTHICVSINKKEEKFNNYSILKNSENIERKDFFQVIDLKEKYIIKIYDKYFVIDNYSIERENYI